MNMLNEACRELMTEEKSKIAKTIGEKAAGNLEPESVIRSFWPETFRVQNRVMNTSKVIRLTS